MKFKRSAFFTCVLTIFLPCVVACNTNDETVTAKIYERKQMDGNRLMIKYKYQVQAKEYSDSATIENTVLENDSIAVKVDKNTPQKSTLQLQKQ